MIICYDVRIHLFNYWKSENACGPDLVTSLTGMGQVRCHLGQVCWFRHWTEQPRFHLNYD